MLNPIRVVIKEIKPIILYIQDFPKTQVFSAITKLALHITATFKYLLGIKTSHNLNVNAIVKTNDDLDIKPELKLKLSGNIRLSSNVKYSDINTNLQLKIDPKLSLSSQMEEIKSNLGFKASIAISMLRPYRIEERMFLTFEQIATDPDLNTIEKFLWKVD